MLITNSKYLQKTKELIYLHYKRYKHIFYKSSKITLDTVSIIHNEITQYYILMFTKKETAIPIKK